MTIVLPDFAQSSHLDYGLYLYAVRFADTGKGLVDYGLLAPITRYDRIADYNALIAIEVAYDIYTESA